MNRKTIVSFLVFVVIVLVVIPWGLVYLERNDWFYSLTSVALLSVAAAGVWLTFYIGRINIGQGAYCLLGGYASAILVLKYDVNFWWTIPIGGAVAAVASFLIGLPILRLKGVYFAMITLVLTNVMTLLALALPITNGAKGMINIPLPRALTLFGLTIIPDFSTLENVKIGFYYLSTGIMLICFVGMYRLTNSRLGHLCRSLQQNEELASSIGVNITYLRLIAYSISSFLGGISGTIFAAISQSVYPSSFTVADSINFMLYCFLGGLGFVFSPMLGTLVLYFGWDLLFQTGQYQLLIFSVLIVGVMLFLPNGLMSIKIKKLNP